MNNIWVFTKNNTRLIKASDGFDRSNLKTYVVDPDLSAVYGVPPHYWKLVDQKVVPMTISEMVAQDSVIASDGVDNEVRKNLPKIDLQKVVGTSHIHELWLRHGNRFTTVLLVIVLCKLLSVMGYF